MADGKSSSSPRTRTRGGRDALISAGAELFADRGIEGVSLREVTRAAGQRNSTALQYHFGGRAGLVKAVVERGASSVAIRRHALLDRQAQCRVTTVRDVASLYVIPLIGELDSGPFGRAFLQVVSHLMNSASQELAPGDALWSLIHDNEGSMERWISLCDPVLPAASVGRPLHRRFTAIRLAHVELARRARSAVSGSSPLFVSHLTDIVEVVMAVPPSPQTLALLGSAGGAMDGVA
ncbi:TetR/AcrR family transcriptional regulator [Rhodococcus sp. NCIMB 12038]|uniref:TetR/AcrR family transcriptional regulator n=1 Tax=Rhodococcus sp. NCIMB 12038 TaxID=933800 RepID=UPI0015C58670|nr:TetR/AcrR family transcriptional regulator [Rhodococcus sp. NCIMB 12038]